MLNNNIIIVQAIYTPNDDDPQVFCKCLFTLILKPTHTQTTPNDLTCDGQWMINVQWITFMLPYKILTRQQERIASMLSSPIVTQHPDPMTMQGSLGG